MAPKKKKEKKTKAQLEEERRLAEEERLRLEAERLRLEEEERARREEEERQRLHRRALQLAAEAELLAEEQTAIEPLLSDHAATRAKAAADRQATRDLERFLACNPLPDVRDVRQMNDHYSGVSARGEQGLPATLARCQQNVQIARDCESYKLLALQEGRLKEVKFQQSQVEVLQASISRMVDEASAHVLHHLDQYPVEHGEVLVATRQKDVAAALWINPSRNPRVKTVELQALSLQLDIPKSLAMAPAALRAQHRSYDPLYHLCKSGDQAVGGVLVLELLALAPPCKKVKGWTLRQITPLTADVQRIPYPIPPAGADPLTWVSEEEVPPLGCTLALPANLVSLEEQPQVGWWDAARCEWSAAPISEVQLDSAAGQLSFKTTALGHLALIQPRSRMLPYTGWSVRPLGGPNASQAVLSLSTKAGLAVEIEVGPAYVQLLRPRVRQLTGFRLAPCHMLQQLSYCGVHLMPEPRDAAHAGVNPKEAATERAMCDDLALLGGVFLLASSRWNATAPSDNCLCRVSEVADWEACKDAEACSRVFVEEAEEGSGPVLVVMRRGEKGVAFSEALDRKEVYPELPEYGAEDFDKTPYGEVHASLLTLLKGTSRELGEEHKPAVDRLRASPESLAALQNTDPVFTQSLAQLMYALRLFSFG